MSTLLEFEAVEPIIDGYPFMLSPVPAMFYVTVYLIFVFKWGPKYMESRKPYELKFVIALYNLFQIFICTYLVHLFLTNGSSFRNTWQCLPKVPMKSPEDMTTLRGVYIALVVRAVEFIETVFFVLRKKQNQVSKLHVYHHVSTFVLLWISVKLSSGYMELYIIIINSLVHIFMYTYYLLALFKPLQPLIRPVKPLITIIQLLQLVIILGHTVTALLPGCPVNKLIFALQIPNISLLIFMFAQFYVKTYNSKKTEKNA